MVAWTFKKTNLYELIYSLLNLFRKKNIQMHREKTSFISYIDLYDRTVCIIQHFMLQILSVSWDPGHFKATDFNLRVDNEGLGGYPAAPIV